MSLPPLHRYGREVERLWTAAFDRALVLSPRDWRAIERWHEQQVPLAVIADAIDDVASRRRRGAPPRGLSYLERSVSELWELVRAGRHHQAPSSGEVEARRAIDVWESSARELQGALRAWLLELVERARAGESPETIESELVEGLWERCEEATRRRIDDELEAALSAHRERMEPALWERTLARNRVRRVRQEIGLPSLVRFL